MRGRSLHQKEAALLFSVKDPSIIGQGWFASRLMRFKVLGRDVPPPLFFAVNGITNEGAGYLLAALSCNTALQSIVLDGMHQKDWGVDVFFVSDVSINFSSNASINHSQRNHICGVSCTFALPVSPR